MWPYAGCLGFNPGTPRNLILGPGQWTLPCKPRPIRTEKEPSCAQCGSPIIPDPCISTPLQNPLAPRLSRPPPEPVHRPAATAGDQATIGKGLLVKGEITGTESLFIDGKVEGSINLPGNRVTVGRNGQVAASVAAREIVILGKVRGNVAASDRVDIRAEGALTGDVTAARISIEDGAFFKGGIDIKKTEVKVAAAAPAPVVVPVPIAEAPKAAQL